MTRRISTHAPRAGSDCQYATGGNGLRDFNPRSPCGERQSLRGGIFFRERFQPTLPVRGATAAWRDGDWNILISTHAPRAGSDDHARLCESGHEHFNPRSPCGERPSGLLGSGCRRLFQPTLPVRGATFLEDVARVIFVISTHAPRAGSD